MHTPEGAGFYAHLIDGSCVQVSVAMTKSNVEGREGFIPHNSSSEAMRGGTRRQELKQRPQRSDAYWLVPMVAQPTFL